MPRCWLLEVAQGLRERGGDDYLAISQSVPLTSQMHGLPSALLPQILNNYSEAQLGRIIRDWGEEKSWRTVARRLVPQPCSPQGLTPPSQLSACVVACACIRGGGTHRSSSLATGSSRQGSSRP